VVRDDDTSCRQCDRSLLYAVVTESSVGEEAARRAARELAGLGTMTEGAAHRRLEQAPGPVLSQATRRTAAAHRAVLVALGIAAHLTLAQPARRDRDLEILTAEEDWWSGRRWIWVVPAVVVVVLVVLGLGWVADLVGPGRAGRAAPDALQRAEAALLRVETGSGQAASLGFVIADGMVVTAALTNDEDAGYLVNGAPSTIVWIDEWLGLAAVAAPAGRDPAFGIGDATAVEPGDPVLLPGTAVRQATVARPVVAIMGLALLELDVGPLARGGGAPVLDAAGRLVAILSSTHVVKGHGALAVPVNYLTAGPEPLLPHDHDAHPWTMRLASVDLPAQRRAEDLAAELARPALLHARLQPGGVTMATVGSLSAAPPAPGRLSFRLHSGARPPVFQAAVPRWRPASLDDVGGQPLQARWLERHGHYLFYFTAEVPVEVVCSGCPVAEADLELLDGRPGHARTTIEPAVRRPRRSAESRRWQRPVSPTKTPSPW
jgi:hypothetical protein